MQPTDILYGPGTCVFHTDVLAKTQCEGCGDEIGRVVDGTFEAWSSSLTMSRNGTKTLLHSGTGICCFLGKLFIIDAVLTIPLPLVSEKSYLLCNSRKKLEENGGKLHCREMYSRGPPCLNKITFPISFCTHY